MTIPAGTATIADCVRLLEQHYRPSTAESWDRVGLVLGEPQDRVERVLLVVDCVPETVEQAVEVGAQLIVAHHPLLLRGVSSVAPTTYKGAIVHRLIRAGIGLFTAHTNADAAVGGVSDALADRLGLVDLRTLHPIGDSAAVREVVPGHGRYGRLPRPMTLTELAGYAAARLPATAWGVRAAGDPGRTIETVAVCGGAGDSFFADAVRVGVDAYLTGDLRHHPVSELIAEGGPALIDAGHWATERPWLDTAAALLREGLPVETIPSELNTDPWTVHAR